MEQVKIIETLLKASADQPIKEHDQAFIVSRSWVDKALALRGDHKTAKEHETTETLGPVDNSDIIERVIKVDGGDDFVLLKPGTGLEEFELFPEDAWKMVIEWYGVVEGQKPIVRTAINTAMSSSDEPNIMYEFHPPVFRIHRLWSEVSPLPIEQALKASNPAAIELVRSRQYHAQTFIKEVKAAVGVPIDRKVRLWTVPGTTPAAAPAESSRALTPPDSPGRSQDTNSSVDSWSKLLLDIQAFSEVSDTKTKVAIIDQTNNQNYNGKTTLQVYDLYVDSTIVIDESIDNFWVSTYTGRVEKSIPTRGNGLASSNASGRSSPALSGPLTRGRTCKKSGRSIGAVGLQNLGNTCYMNSALQCVRSVEELTKYFLTNEYSDEVNKSNPLGYNGKVAMAYGNLLKDIYTEGRGSVVPRDFKTTVGRCRTTFSGWGQQDTQEFLGFLLDALQEDLSRVKKKPYIEKPDSTDDMINNPEAIKKMADEVWDITRRRDDSVIADLFTGMYKSTLKCPECDKVSITFDPFNNLTLPIPVESVCARTIKFLPLNDVPVMIEAEIPKHSAIEQLKQFVSVRTGVPVERLMAAEEYKDRFFKIYDDTADVSDEIGNNDLATFHELEAVPTNWPHKVKPKKYRSMLDIATPLENVSEWDDPRYGKMVVPVFHRRPAAVGRDRDWTPPPHFVTLSKEEASNIDIIQRKVLEKIATFSTWSALTDMASDNPDNADGETVLGSASDADSSSDSKVVANSVESEEDMVDVHMKGTSDRDSVTPVHVPQILKRFNSKRPDFTNPDSFLNPQLQNLFELSYFTDNSTGSVPTGWSTVDNNRSLPKLSDRIPEPSDDEKDTTSPNSDSSTMSGGDDDSNDDNKSDVAQTRMADESSEEETRPVKVRFLYFAE